MTEPHQPWLSAPPSAGLPSEQGMASTGTSASTWARWSLDDMMRSTVVFPGVFSATAARWASMYGA